MKYSNYIRTKQLTLLLHNDSFEKELKNKLGQKTQGAQSEESVLKKAFKYFDLNDNGTVEPDEFQKAIEKIGIMIPTKQVSHITFPHFCMGFNFIYFAGLDVTLQLI